jgi:FkbM family methyltransferase
MDSPAFPPSRANSLWPGLVDKFRQLCGYQFPRLGPAAFAGILKTLPSVIETQLFPGIRATLDLRDETQRTTYWFGTRFEQPTPQMLREWAADATHFFDIGSNYGFYSFFLHSLFSHLNIYSFEPNPAAFHRLMEICAVNGTARIHPQPYGLSDEGKRLKFLQLSGNTGHSSFAAVETYLHDNSMLSGATLTECDVIQYDEAVKHLGLDYPATPSWIAKIDVEGYEFKVLLGMAEALRKKAFKGICVELVADNLSLSSTSVEQVDAFLRGYGYSQIPSIKAGQNCFGRNHNAFYVCSETGANDQHVSEPERCQ